jgi:adenosylmethionine-8-amino-7-oxononanoate aminotransferase
MEKSFESLKDHPHVSDVRQTGMVLAIEMVKNKKNRTAYNWKERRGIRAYLHGLKNNVLMRPLGNVLYFMPPYVISKKEISFVSEIMKEGVNEATKKSS